MRATACFTQYLATKRSSNRIEIEIKRLRRKLMGLRRRNSDDTPRGDPFHGEDSDNVLREWKDTWVAGFSNDEVRERHIRALFRYGLGAEEESEDYKQYFYSFCEGRWEEDAFTWHCGVCRECQSWQNWHCGRCGECKHGLSIPCEGCGGVSDIYHRT